MISLDHHLFFVPPVNHVSGLKISVKVLSLSLQAGLVGKRFLNGFISLWGSCFFFFIFYLVNFNSFYDC